MNQPPADPEHQSDEEFQAAAEGGVVAVEHAGRVPTFRQYVNAIHREAAVSCGLSVAEVSRDLPESMYHDEWLDHVVRSFDGGATITTRLWRSLSEGMQYRLLRSTRALRDEALTRELVSSSRQAVNQ